MEIVEQNIQKMIKIKTVDFKYGFFIIHKNKKGSFCLLLITYSLEDKKNLLLVHPF